MIFGVVLFINFMPPPKKKWGTGKWRNRVTFIRIHWNCNEKERERSKSKNFLSKEDSFESTSNLLYLSFFKKWHFGISDRAVSCRSYSCSSFRHIWSFLQRSLLGWDGSWMQRTRWPWNRFFRWIRWSTATVYQKKYTKLTYTSSIPSKNTYQVYPFFLTALVSEKTWLFLESTFGTSPYLGLHLQQEPL